jgi:purine-nucleoside phosphorylase
VTESDAIINPQRGKKSPQLGPVAVMASTEPDLFLLCSRLNFNQNAFHKLFISRLYPDQKPTSNVSISGPLVGAPYAAMLLETLIAWGASKIVFLGWCGSISEQVKIGDIIIPTSAIIDEGTSRHYQDKTMRVAFPSERMITTLQAELDQNRVNFHQGPIWTTDAVYRETRQKVEYYQRQGAIGVEMETSALFTVAQFRKVDLGGMLVVSDELSSFVWRPGFKTDSFVHAREVACTVIKDLCQKI